MLQKIKYRLTDNYACRLNKDSLAPVSLEARQGSKKVYFSSRVMLKPGQWEHGKVVNHENGSKLTVYLIHWQNMVEEIELDALLNGRQLSLTQLKTAVKSGVHPSATIKEFTESVIGGSSRCDRTKSAYTSLVKSIEEQQPNMTIADISYDWIERWRASMRNKGLSENTVKGRLKQLRCICSEAMKRNVLEDDPFKFIKIGNMSARRVYLTLKEVEKFEKMKLDGNKAIIRDLFVFSCYSALRWSDLSTLEEAEIKDGMLRKVMKKTKREVIIPIDKLFWGRAKAILDRYPDITKLSHVCCNTTGNRVIKELANELGITKKVSFHAARKSAACNLNQLGLSTQEISEILGHTKTATTTSFYIFNNGEKLKKSVGKMFKSQ